MPYQDDHNPIKTKWDRIIEGVLTFLVVTLLVVLGINIGSKCAQAGEFYAEVGIGIHPEKLDASGREAQIKGFTNPLGIIEVGYQFDKHFSIQFEHVSSIPKVDYGLNMLSIRYRF